MGRAAYRSTGQTRANDGDAFRSEQQRHLTSNEDWDDPELSARLTASKKAELCTVKDNPEDPGETRDSLIELAEMKARSLMAGTKKLIPAPVIGIVPNRVGTARIILTGFLEVRSTTRLLTGLYLGS